MLKTRVIPCLLLKDWNIVKTVQFSSVRVNGNPVQYVRVYNTRNVDELTILDIDAPRNNTEPKYNLVSDLAKECFMPLAIGGGVKSVDNIRRLLVAGADKVVINTSAYYNPEFIKEAVEIFGSQCVVVSIDVKREKRSYIVKIKGGKKSININPVSWAKKVAHLGVGEILLTSIDNDGMMKGYDITLIKSVADAVSIPVIANGGAGRLEDFVEAVRVGNASAVAAASIFLYTQITPMNVKKFMNENGIETRV